MSTDNDASAIGRLVGITLDCVDPAALTELYRALSGWDVSYADDDVVVLGDGPTRLALQRVGDHRPPTWPGADKQLHLDFTVADLEEAERRVLALGAVKPAFQPGGDRWHVYQDPAGHPFCLSTSNA